VRGQYYHFKKYFTQNGEKMATLTINVAFAKKNIVTNIGFQGTAIFSRKVKISQNREMTKLTPRRKTIFTNQHRLSKNFSYIFGTHFLKIYRGKSFGRNS
jgi:hypothetical protein